MDWKFVVNQLVTAATIIVSTAIAAVIVARYKRLGSLGVSQRLQDRLIAIIFAIGILGVPLFMLVWTILKIHRFVDVDPTASVSRNDAAVIAVWIASAFVFAGQFLVFLWTYLARWRKRR
jgi:hypothetical protein